MLSASIRIIRALPIHCILAGGFAGVLVAGCSGALVDPTKNAPIRPSELSDAEESAGAPDAVPPSMPEILPGALSPHAATAIRISELSRVERLENAPTLIDVRLDATDDRDEPASIAGDLRILIHCDGADPATLAFDVRLRTQPEVRRRRDEVLEQYVLRLEPVWTRDPARGSAIRVSANLLTTEGRLLRGELGIVW